MICIYVAELGACARGVPWERLEPGPVVTLKRVVATLILVVTFFCGWNRMMWILGAKRQPSTTEPLRLTEMHIVVVWTWRTQRNSKQTLHYSSWRWLGELLPTHSNLSRLVTLIVLCCISPKAAHVYVYSQCVWSNNV